MADVVTFTPASAMALEALAELFTRSFETYFYPGVTTPQVLARRVAVENIDLLHSIVLRVNGDPAGVALLARRGPRAWCGGFGVTRTYRGRGYAHLLASELLRQARATGATHLTLEVLTRNTAALRIYERAGLSIIRRLLILAWRPDDEHTMSGPALDPAEPSGLVLEHFAAMHPVAAAWQREPAALLALPDIRGMALHEDMALSGYALLLEDEATRIVDLGARDEASARRLIAGLQAHTNGLTSLNEPSDSPLTAAYLRSGFIVVDEQHELALAL